MHTDVCWTEGGQLWPVNHALPVGPSVRPATGFILHLVQQTTRKRRFMLLSNTLRRFADIHRIFLYLIVTPPQVLNSSEISVLLNAYHRTYLWNCGWSHANCISGRQTHSRIVCFRSTQEVFYPAEETTVIIAVMMTIARCIPAWIPVTIWLYDSL